MNEVHVKIILKIRSVENTVRSLAYETEGPLRALKESGGGGMNGGELIGGGSW